MQRKLYTLIIVSVVTGLFAWAPWITQDTASKLAEEQFNTAWSTIIDGCGIYGKDDGKTEFQKVLFGAYVTLYYQCGLIRPDEAALKTKVYVSFLGIASGYPKP